MGKTLRQRDEERDLFLASRREFLRGGAAVAGAAGLAAVLTKSAAVSAASGGTGGVSSLAASIGRPIERTPDRLGTTPIVGTIQRKPEIDNGFLKGMRGLFDKAILNECEGSPPRFVSKEPLSFAAGMMCDVIAPAVDGPVRPEKLPIPGPKEMSAHIKALARFLRADDCGVGPLPPYAVYSHKAPFPVTPATTVADCQPINLTHPNAITIVIDQDLPTFRGSTGFDGISASQSMMAYLTSGVIACVIAAYIRNLGYSAKAHHGPLFHYEVVVPPVLISTGQGEMCRVDGAALHPRLGLRHKAAVVTTDLPLEADPPIDFGIREFCSKCMKCADNCPSGAISHEKDPVEYNGYMKWPFDIAKCTYFRYCNHDGASCGRCVKVCPWSSKEDSWYHAASSWAASRTGSVDTLLKQIDDFFGFGTEIREDMKWWLEWPEIY